MTRGSLVVLAAALVGVLGIAAIGNLPGESVPATTPIVAASSTTVAAAGPGTSAVPAATATLATAAPAPTTAAPTTVAPTTAAPAVVLPAGTPADGNCPDAGRAAVVDRDRQRTWLCDAGAPVAVMPITSAWSMPDPGDYPVYAKDLRASSTFGGYYSTMTHFVAFSYGKNTGARVAFHSVPKHTDGQWVQPLDSVGDLGRRGESSGCIRVLPDDAVRIWDWLALGDTVRVIN